MWKEVDPISGEIEPVYNVSLDNWKTRANGKIVRWIWLSVNKTEQRIVSISFLLDLQTTVSDQNEVETFWPVTIIWGRYVTCKFNSILTDLIWSFIKIVNK